MDINSDKQITITRDELYGLVWAEPMIEVAKKFGVSSSYMARICTQLDIPRPERGYWARLKYGKKVKQTPLPETPPGISTLFMINRHKVIVPKTLPKPPTKKPRAKKNYRRPKQHDLLIGAKEHFETGNLSYEAGYLKPAKHLVVDIAVTKTGLQKALAFANELFLTLEERGHRVAIASQREQFWRGEVEHLVEPSKNRRQGYYHNNLWGPSRCTVVYIGTVAIGLTVIEMAEEAEARYVNGDYVRLEDVKRGSYYEPYSWTATREYPTGRLRLYAYSPYGLAKWSFTWEEKGKRQLINQIKSIVKTLEEAAVEVARLVEEGEDRAEQQRKERAQEQERRRIAEEKEHRIKLYNESRAEIFEIIEEWAKQNQIEQFFKDLEGQVDNLEPEDAERLMARLDLAREMIGSIDALDHFLKWKSPDER